MSERRGIGWIAIIQSTVIVAIVTGVLNLFAQSSSDDVKRCKIATDFLTAEPEGLTLLPEAERLALIRSYIRLARENCGGPS